MLISLTCACPPNLEGQVQGTNLRKLPYIFNTCWVPSRDLMRVNGWKFSTDNPGHRCAQSMQVTEGIHRSLQLVIGTGGRYASLFVEAHVLWHTDFLCRVFIGIAWFLIYTNRQRNCNLFRILGVLLRNSHVLCGSDKIRLWDS